MNDQMSLMSGNPFQSDQATWRADWARMASHSFGATTPTKSPLVTTCAPVTGGSKLPMPMSFERIPVGRTTRPCSMPGTFTSCMYVNSPVTLGGMSTRGTDVPTMVYFDGSLGVAVPLSAVVNGTSIPSGVVSTLSSTLKFLSPINWAYEILPVPSARLTMPLLTDRLSAGTLSCLAASPSSALRASA